MSIPITNDAMLMQILGKDFTKIIDELTTWLLEKLEEIIADEVYTPYQGQYERLRKNGGFLGAWYRDVPRFITNYLTTGSIESSISFEPSFLELNPEKHQHGNLAGEDRRENLAEYIEEGATGSYDFGGNAARPRPFWYLIEEIITSGDLDKVFEIKMLQHGIKFQKT